ncbi:Uncharacterised protein [Mycobacteroides abscessus subsp. abscessus]|nr:Uncharacterised protein [Mycobacteroides abscessus subsp. abscessus]
MSCSRVSVFFAATLILRYAERMSSTAAMPSSSRP